MGFVIGGIVAAVIIYMVLLGSGENNKALTIAYIIIAIILFIVLGLTIGGDKKNKGNSYKDDSWKCPSCGHYIDDDINWCPNCVKEGLKD